ELPRPRGPHAAPDLRAAARSSSGVLAVRGAARLRPAAADLALPPPDPGLSHHWHRYSIAQRQAQRSAVAWHEAAVLPQAVGHSRRAVWRMDRRAGRQGQRSGVPRMTARAGAALLAAVAAAALSSAGCAAAVKHPAIAAGIVGSTLGFGTCKLASD